MGIALLRNEDAILEKIDWLWKLLHLSSVLRCIDPSVVLFLSFCK